MNRIFEEVVEAIWVGDERGKNGIDDIREICDVKIEDEILEAMEKDEIIGREGSNIFLTGKGRENGRGIIRRKRLAEVLLMYVLNIKGDEADRIVCEFEHAVIPEVEESICILLGHPRECPHNQEIPRGACCKTGKSDIDKMVSSITEMEIGEKIKIAYLKPGSHDRLHRLLNFGIKPGTIIEIHQKRPTFIIRFDNSEIAMDIDIAKDIYGWSS
ncbi:metal-dependent transcriptional regulator [Spirochaetota bacterium]